MDWSTGEILDALEKLGLDDNTLVIWTCDHGAVKWDPPQGSNAPMKGWAYDASEAAMRPPFIARWPGHIEAGWVCDTVASTMDIFPTLAGLAGAPLPSHTIDAHDMWPLLQRDPDARSAYDETGFFYYAFGQLQAVRSGPWRLDLPLSQHASWVDRFSGPQEAALYNLEEDISQTTEVSAQHPDVVERLLSLAEWARDELGDLDRQGTGQRPGGWVEDPVPLRLPAR